MGAATGEDGMTCPLPFGVTLLMGLSPAPMVDHGEPTGGGPEGKERSGPADKGAADPGKRVEIGAGRPLAAPERRR